MNFVIGLALLLLASLFGIGIANGYKRRLKFLCDMDSFLLFLQGNCAFLQDSFRKVLTSQKSVYGIDFNQFLSDLETNLDKRDKYLSEWQSTQKIISKDEAKFIAEVLLNFGKLDSSSQIEELKNAKRNWNEKIQSARVLTNSKGTMATKLGIILGIGLFIIVV